ncbi:hypothetical protein VF14_18530 [Nostoc linckia z18]|uniref:Uncharacterized protein n=1 Tax=Nostoc linckia z8 TaxID=1628746 RepID=A0A9Q5Z575_NOSLI|nr:hypothetical protein [Nostoc linckia]PHJ50697.1 hypothetical protein VF02_38090 [Nostoc linckia z1]PHJ94038.1 hypothetical protein VF08_34480 [Nostoc linckia z8]PHK33110.1 hypothetical protein VF14_18530 [Nostoc linckia z18]PHJ82001.1 hypothetical protein VF07_29370 [Nostoc linckia z6]PHK09345.1 hypothetical protein VF09_16145 [Nostoc linckia z9]
MVRIHAPDGADDSRPHQQAQRQHDVERPALQEIMGFHGSIFPCCPFFLPKWKKECQNYFYQFGIEGGKKPCHYQAYEYQAENMDE